MKSADLLASENVQIMQNLTTAMNAGDEAGMQTALTAFCDGVQQRIVEEAQQLSNTNDTNILAQRGVRQLTSDETKFYQSWLDAHKSENVKQELTNIDRAMPETIIDSVIEEMQEAHPLLEAIDFMNASGAIKMFINAGDVQLATCEKLTTAITNELSGAIEVVELTQCKLSAFIPVSKDMLDLGPVWLDNYVRIILTEATSLGLEASILKGTGKNQPIGACKDLKGSVVEGVYPDKAKVALTSLEPEEYCEVIAPLAVKPTGGYRAVPEVLLVVNPVDYIKKVIPASTIKDSNGKYVNNVFPYPTKCIQSAALSENEAVLGIAKRYFMAVGAGKSGKLEYSDEYQFLEDNRVYLTKLYGIGRPKDNNAFAYLDVTNMKPAPIKVKNVE